MRMIKLYQEDQNELQTDGEKKNLHTVAQQKKTKRRLR